MAGSGATSNRDPNELLKVVIAVLILGAVIVGVVAVAAYLNANHIRTLERTDARAQRLATASACVRGNALRAELHASARTVRGVDLLAKREARIPILDCFGYVNGSLPRPLTVAEQRKFVHAFVETGELPAICGGRVYTSDAPCTPIPVVPAAK